MVSLGWVFEGLCLVEKRQLLLATLLCGDTLKKRNRLI